MLDSINFSGRLYPVDEKSENIIKKREFALVGISPFNSYFSADRIFEILQVVDSNFVDYAIFIPDKISRFTLKALGYDEKRIACKVRKQDNYLINKAKKALDKLNNITDNKKQNYDKIISLSDIKNTNAYIDSYNRCYNLIETDKKFKEGCLETSSFVLASYKNNKQPIYESNKITALQYFLEELPLFLSSPEILKVNSCIFVYISIPAFLKEIYDSYDLSSLGAGFAVFKNA